MPIIQNNFKRIRFLFRTLTSSSGVMTLYAPLLIMLTLVGVAAPFATGRLIDALAYRLPPTAVRTVRRPDGPAALTHVPLSVAPALHLHPFPQH